MFIDDILHVQIHTYKTHRNRNIHTYGDTCTYGLNIHTQTQACYVRTETHGHICTQDVHTSESGVRVVRSRGKYDLSDNPTKQRTMTGNCQNEELVHQCNKKVWSHKNKYFTIRTMVLSFFNWSHKNQGIDKIINLT